MKTSRDCFVVSLLAMTVVVSLSGCATSRLKKLEQENTELKTRLEWAQAQRAQEIQRLEEEKRLAAQKAAQETAQEADQLLEAQRRLAQTLQKELGEAKAKLSMTERGLVLTFLDEIFFDSGKSVVKPEGMETLEKVVPVLKETVPNAFVAIEGHTDNEPIRYSGWRSNWELSSARSLAVVHHLIDTQGLSPDRLRAVGYGEFHPVEPNETSEGRRQNRRVEIVILPETLQKIKSSP